MDHIPRIPGTSIPYQLRRSSRARRIRLSVRSDCTVSLSLPRFVSVAEAERFLIEKSGWVVEKIRLFEARGPLVRIGGGAAEFKERRREAHAYIERLIARVNAHYGFSYTTITMCNATSRWGSCSATGKLAFNYKLLFVPEHLAEYVVAHELCHLRELNHSARFWGLVAQAIPDYKARKKELKNYTVR